LYEKGRSRAATGFSTTIEEVHKRDILEHPESQTAGQLAILLNLILK
jgi:hypothetical protein